LSYFDELAKANAEETLKQEELLPLFSRANKNLKECVKILVQENQVIQNRIVSLGAEIASNIDRNKAIFTRSLRYEEDNLVDIIPNKLEQQQYMLCQCLDLQKAMATNDVSKQIEIIENIPISRMIFEDVIVTWLNTVKEYTKQVDYNVMSASKDNIDNYLKSSLKVHNLEKSLGLNPVTSYSTIRFVNSRMEAIRSIYNRIAKAYARSVLKMARGLAVYHDYVLDSYQNGNFGLMRAISSYDHISNARFPGYAAWWIKQKMLFCMKEEANVIKISSNTWQHYAKLESFRNKIEGKKGSITIEDIAKAANYTVEKAESIYNSIKASQVKSLEYNLSSEGFNLLTVASGTDDPVLVEDASTAAEEILAIEEQTTHEEQDSKRVEILLKNLPKDLKKIVCLKFGLLDKLSQEIDPDRVAFERMRQQVAALRERAINNKEGEAVQA
jgi:RNA polymerase sigma factor (sigma-70 family)